MKLKDINLKLKQSATQNRILSQLAKSPETFLVLQEKVGISSQTLSEHLKFCEKHGLVRHEKRNAPYQITEKGLEWLKLTATKPVEDFTVECVKGGAFGGSIIFRVPEKFAKVFSELYTPRPLEGLRRVLNVAFQFWVNRYSSEGAHLMAFGTDFNNDKIWDLTMYETPASGYPNIKKALKKGEFMLDGKKMEISQVSLWLWALNALEEKLSKATFEEGEQL